MGDLTATKIIEEAIDAVDEGQGQYLLINEAGSYIRKHYPATTIVNLWGSLQALEAYLDAYVDEYLSE